MSNSPESARPKDVTFSVLITLFGAIAGVNLLQQQWLDGVTWACLAVAMLLAQRMDLRQPGAWKQPRHLAGILLTVASITLIFIQIIVDLSQ